MTEKKRPKTVVVVGADRAYHDLFATALSLQGYAVLRATDPEDALAVVMERRPSLVILQYPVRVGDRTLTARIREAPEVAETVILNITPRNVPSHLAAATAEGVDLNLLMPVPPIRLVQEVRRLIGSPG